MKSAGIAQQQSACSRHETPVSNPAPRSTNLPAQLMALEHVSGAWWEIIDERGRKIGVISYPFGADPGATEAVARRLVRAWNSFGEPAGDAS